MVKPIFVSDVVEKVCDTVTRPFSEVIPEPPPPAIQEPFTEIHPPVTAMPFAKVDVAVVLVIFKAWASIPPAKVEVAFASPRIVVVAVLPTVKLQTLHRILYLQSLLKVLKI
jgi:hypothetical protein